MGVGRRKFLIKSLDSFLFTRRNIFETEIIFDGLKTFSLETYGLNVFTLLVLQGSDF